MTLTIIDYGAEYDLTEYDLRGFANGHIKIGFRGTREQLPWTYGHRVFVRLNGLDFPADVFVDSVFTSFDEVVVSGDIYLSEPVACTPTHAFHTDLAVTLGKEAGAAR
jgi:hypothetical protein